MKPYQSGKQWFIAIKIFLVSLIATFSISAYAYSEYYYVDDYSYYYYDCPRPRSYDYRPCDYVVCDQFTFKSHYRRAPQRGSEEVADYIWIDP